MGSQPHPLLLVCVLLLSVDGSAAGSSSKTQPLPKWDSSLSLDHIAWGEGFDNISHLQARLDQLFLRPDRVFKLVVLGNTSRVDLAATCNRIFGRGHFTNQTILDERASPFGLFYLPGTLSHEISAVVVACTSITPPGNDTSISGTLSFHTEHETIGGAVDGNDANQQIVPVPKLDVRYLSSVFFDLLPSSPTATIYCMSLIHDPVTDVRVVGYRDIAVAQQLHDLFPDVYHALTFLLHVILEDDDDELAEGPLNNKALEIMRLEALVVQQIRRLLPRGDLLSHFLYINNRKNSTASSLDFSLPPRRSTDSSTPSTPPTEEESEVNTALAVQDEVRPYFLDHPHRELLSIVLALHAAAVPLEQPQDLPSMLALGSVEKQDQVEETLEERRAREYTFVMHDLYQRYHCSASSGEGQLTAEDLALQLTHARMRTRTGALYDKLRGVPHGRKFHAEG